MRYVSMWAVAILISCACLGQSARDIARVAFKSVVLLEMNDSNGQPLSLGSGFFVSNGIIATNAHVIQGASSGSAKLIGDSHRMQILGTVAIDHHADLALLKVDSTAPSLVLDPNAIPNVGDNVFVVGNPLGLEGTFSEGIISGVRRIEEDSILQMTAPISPGSSGGPVMGSSGAVIGISVATFQYGQNLNLAVPVSYLSKLLTSAPKSFVPLANQKIGVQAEKSILDGVGTKTEDGIKISEYQLTVNPNYPYIQGTYELRIANRLPVGVSGIKLLILYYDASDSLMDYENLSLSSLLIPAGLTKTIHAVPSNESRHAASYYEDKRIAAKVEIRVIKFNQESAE